MLAHAMICLVGVQFNDRTGGGLHTIKALHDTLDELSLWLTQAIQELNHVGSDWTCRKFLKLHVNVSTFSELGSLLVTLTYHHST